MVTYHYLTILHGNQSLSDNLHGYISLSANRETRCPSLECCGSDREVGLQINPFTRVFCKWTVPFVYYTKWTSPLMHNGESVDSE